MQNMKCKVGDHVIFRKKSKRNQMQIYKGQIVEMKNELYTVKTDSGNQIVITEADVDRVI